MHYCEMELQGLVVEPCDRPASVKHEGRWYCEFHYDALLAAEARWAVEFPAVVDDEDDDFEDDIDED